MMRKYVIMVFLCSSIFSLLILLLFIFPVSNIKRLTSEVCLIIFLDLQANTRYCYRILRACIEISPQIEQKYTAIWRKGTAC
jgi:hypothetical protein